MASIIPELRLYKMVKALLKEVKADHERESRENTFLWHLFGEESDWGKYDYYDEAVALFVNREEDNPKKVTVRSMYDRDVTSAPTIHITMPSDTSNHNSLGINESSEAVFDEVSNTFTPMLGRNFDSTFIMVCTAPSSQEVVLMYHVLRAILISAMEYIELMGLRNPVLGGQDIRAKEENTPQLYMKGVTLSCFYSVKVPRFFKSKIISDIALSVKPVAGNTGTNVQTV